MPANPIDDSQRLLAFNQQLLQQALALAAAHAGPGRPRYVGLVGSHLRHVVEHYEALLFPAQEGVVDYDARPRDAELETSPHLARTRLQALQQALAAWPTAGMTTALQVRGQGGLEGDFHFQIASSMGRELAFVASHTIHHFALLASHCQQQGIPTPEGFGKAPATRAHERARRNLVCA